MEFPSGFLLQASYIWPSPSPSLFPHFCFLKIDGFCGQQPIASFEGGVPLGMQGFRLNLAVSFSNIAESDVPGKINIW